MRYRDIIFLFFFIPVLIYNFFVGFYRVKEIYLIIGNKNGFKQDTLIVNETWYDLSANTKGTMSETQLTDYGYLKSNGIKNSVSYLKENPPKSIKINDSTFYDIVYYSKYSDHELYTHCPTSLNRDHYGEILMYLYALYLIYYYSRKIYKSCSKKS